MIYLHSDSKTIGIVSLYQSSITFVFLQKFPNKIRDVFFYDAALVNNGGCCYRELIDIFF